MSSSRSATKLFSPTLSGRLLPRTNTNGARTSSLPTRLLHTTSPLASSSRPRTAIVTGAARGIGKAIALRLARDGLDVTINDVPALAGELDAVASEIASATTSAGRTPRALVHVADVTSEEAVDGLVRASVAALGPLDAMIANAGIAQVKFLEEVDAADFARMLAVNVIGVHNCFRSAARQMRTQAEGIPPADRKPRGHECYGKLVAAASVAAFRPAAMLGHYGASKWAARGLTHAWACEMAAHGITANAYAPGIVGTAMWDLIDEGMAEREGVPKGEVFRRSSDRAIALGRTSVPEDVSNVVSFLASTESDYVTGQTYVVDGGMIYT